VTFLAAGVQGVTGFGHALVAIGFLSILLGPKEAILVLTLLAPVIAITLFVKVRRDVAWRETIWLGAALLAGIGPGIALFAYLPSGSLRRVVGGLLLVFTAWYASPVSPRIRRLGRGWAVLAGGAGGFLNGLTSTGGPPLVLFLLSHDIDKRTRLAVLQALFLIGSLAKVAMASGAGLFSAPVVARSAILAAPLVAGVLLGNRLFDRLDARWIRALSLVLLGVMGVALLAGL
jgi:uncharacterized membrane protein YfcA